MTMTRRDVFRVTTAVPLVIAVLLGMPGPATVRGATVTSTHGHAPASTVRNGPLTIATIDRGIWSIDSRGHAHQVFPCTPPRCYDLESIDWAPGGRRLVFSVTTVTAKSSYNGIHVITPSTGADRHLCPRGVHFPHLCPEGFSFAWSPDGKRIAYVIPGAVGHIYLMNPDGSDRTLLRTGTGGLDSSPSWSPDGRQIAFATGGGHRSSISLVNRDGSHRRLVFRGVTPPGLPIGSPNPSPWPDWSPDGTRIAFQWGCGIKVVTLQGKDATPRSANTSRLCFGLPGAPVWSPDGHEIAMGVRGFGTYIMDADGSHLTRVSTEDGRGMFGTARPSWQPLP